MFNTRQFISNFKAIRGSYAPSKVQDAYTNLLVVTLVVMIGLLAYGTYLFPMMGMIGVILGFSALITVRVIQYVYTIVKYLIKGE